MPKPERLDDAYGYVTNVYTRSGYRGQGIGSELMERVVAWMFPLMSHDDRENMTRIWQMVMPPPAFARAKQLIQNAIGSDWAELTRRIPTLP